jgi:hypothetical protein
MYRRKNLLFLVKSSGSYSYHIHLKGKLLSFPLQNVDSHVKKYIKFKQYK